MNVHACICVYMHLYVCTCMYMNVHTCICLYMHMNMVHSYIYASTCTHVNMHMRMLCVQYPLGIHTTDTVLYSILWGGRGRGTHTELTNIHEHAYVNIKSYTDIHITCIRYLFAWHTQLLGDVLRTSAKIRSRKHITCMHTNKQNPG
jgi:hypothetical protein